MPDIPGELLDENTPKEVEIRLEPRRPATDPTLGVPVPPSDDGTQQHRLVTVGDSLTHGFQSGAIFNTDLSFPAIIAYEMGWLDRFRRPHYRGFGGLPINIEYLVRELEGRYGSHIGGLELAFAVYHARHWMDQVEDWWERGSGLPDAEPDRDEPQPGHLWLGCPGRHLQQRGRDAR